MAELESSLSVVLTCRLTDSLLFLSPHLAEGSEQLAAGQWAEWTDARLSTLVKVYRSRFFGGNRESKQERAKICHPPFVNLQMRQVAHTPTAAWSLWSLPHVLSLHIAISDRSSPMLLTLIFFSKNIFQTFFIQGSCSFLPSHTVQLFK